MIEAEFLHGVKNLSAERRRAHRVSSRPQEGEESVNNRVFHSLCCRRRLTCVHALINQTPGQKQTNAWPRSRFLAASDWP